MNLTPTRAAHIDRFFATKIERIDNEIALLERRLPYEQKHNEARAIETAARITKLQRERYNAIAFKNQ